MTTNSHERTRARSRAALSDVLESTNLGPTRATVSRVGLGGCPLGGHGWGHTDQAELYRVVATAVDLGVNFFDTADVYGFGQSEELLSKALGPNRHKVIVASKFGVRWDSSGRTTKDISPKYLRTALDNSLRRLRLDCIPLYYIHWPDGKTPIGETLTELARVRDEGKIRWIGVSNFSPDEFRIARSCVDICAIQIQYSLVDQGLAERLLPALADDESTLVTWGSLAQGLLTGKFGPETVFSADDRRSRYENFRPPKFGANLQVARLVTDIARDLGKTAAQVAIRWLLDSGRVGTVLCGAKTSDQILDNLGALGWNLPEHVFKHLQHVTRDPIFKGF